MQTLGPHPDSTESETQEIWLRNLSFKKPFRWFWYRVKFVNPWPSLSTDLNQEKNYLRNTGWSRQLLISDRGQSRLKRYLKQNSWSFRATVVTAQGAQNGHRGWNNHRQKLHDHRWFFPCFNHKVIYQITLDTKDKQSARKHFQIDFKRKYVERKNYTRVLWCTRHCLLRLFLVWFICSSKTKQSLALSPTILLWLER